MSDSDRSPQRYGNGNSNALIQKILVGAIAVFAAFFIWFIQAQSSHTSDLAEANSKLTERVARLEGGHEARDKAIDQSIGDLKESIKGLNGKLDEILLRIPPQAQLPARR